MKAIFWDFDGTLVSSPMMWSKCITKALNEVSDENFDFMEVRKFTRRGYPWDRFYRDNRGLTHENFWSFMENRFSVALIGMGLSQEIRDKTAQNVRKYILSTENYSIFPDAVETLLKCKAKGYKNYLVSNNYPELKEVMKAIGILKHFEEIIVSGEVGFDKPRKEIFEIALEIAKNPKTVYMVGDNPIADIVGAKNLGIPTILVHNHASSNADFFCENLSDVLNIIE